MGKKVRKPHEQKSVIEEFIQKQTSIKTMGDDNCFVISFKHFDRSQSQSFYDWQGSGMLAAAIDVLSNYCSRPLLEQCDGKKFTIYGDFPHDKSKYSYPTYIPQDANWARIHIDGVHIVAGHIFKNTFYVVFLDPDHGFYITSRN